MIILGISAYYHDSAAAIIIDGTVAHAVLEERLNRQKHYNGFPVLACIECLKETSISIEEIDYVVFYEKPFVKFERLLRAHISYAPKGLSMFLKSMPIWLKDKLNMRELMKKEFKKTFGKSPKNILFSYHHLSHAANAFYTSGLKESAILVIDAVGELSTTSIYKANDEGLTLMDEMNFPHSIGLLYSSFTYFLGFQVNSDEYKVMGLAAYGKPGSEEVDIFEKVIREKLITKKENGFFEIHPQYFSYMYKERMIDDKDWARLFGIPIRKDGDAITQSHKNLAYAIQKVTTEIVKDIANYAKRLTNVDNLCISGGCALNCAAIGALEETGIFTNVFVPYAPGDDGAAIGAALAAFHLSNQNLSVSNRTPYTGRKFSNEEILSAIIDSGLKYDLMTEDEMLAKVSCLLNDQKVIGWMQGRMEFGPRALGNRSILADATKTNMKERINSSVKFREYFRPFAPIVLKEDIKQVFGIDRNSPYMMAAYSVKDNQYNAIVHEDFTARVQTVSEMDNELLYKLLIKYKNDTGRSVLLNTSFNVMGEPIVYSPQDAIRTFLNSGIDILVMNNIIAYK